MSAIWLTILAKTFVVIGAINWLSIGAFNVNLVQTSFLHHAEHFLYVLIGLCAVYLVIKRDFFLPFLGTTVFPQTLVSSSDQIPPNANISIPIIAPPGSRIVYWAAEPNKTSTSYSWDSPKQAYGFYKNAGVVTANALGEANLKVRNPSSYIVGPFKKQLAPHIHYRISEKDSGMWGPVQTVNTSQ